MLRVGFDVDGVLADFDSAFDAVSEGVLSIPVGRPRTTSDINRVWRQIQRTENWWEGLAPCEPDALSRLRTTTERGNWTVFFLTNRPQTAGRPVQEQTRRWLAEHGYPGAAVAPLTGARARVVVPLELHAIVDDRPDNCVDIARGTSARVWLLARGADDRMADRLASEGVTVVRSLAACIEGLEALQASLTGSRYVRARRWLAERWQGARGKS